MVQPDPNDDDYERRSRANMMVMVAVVIVLIVGGYIGWKMKKETTLEDCFAAGGRNCAPVSTQNH
jgi:Na+/proline symporter